MKRELVLRGGRVTEVFPNGHLLCHGPCIETTIPIFPGMSGAPVMRYAPGTPMQPFGVMSTGHTEDPSLKFERSKPGHSIGPLINPSVSIACKAHNQVV